MYIIQDRKTGKIYKKVGDFPYNAVLALTLRGHNPVVVSLNSATVKYNFKIEVENGEKYLSAEHDECTIEEALSYKTIVVE